MTGGHRVRSASNASPQCPPAREMTSWFSLVRQHRTPRQSQRPVPAQDAPDTTDDQDANAPDQGSNPVLHRATGTVGMLVHSLLCTGDHTGIPPRSRHPVPSAPQATRPEGVRCPDRCLTRYMGPVDIQGPVSKARPGSTTARRLSPCPQLAHERNPLPMSAGCKDTQGARLATQAAPLSIASG